LIGTLRNLQHPYLPITIIIVVVVVKMVKKRIKVYYQYQKKIHFRLLYSALQYKAVAWTMMSSLLSWQQPTAPNQLELER
jgi:hypothetical protein